jgi:DedD protein
MVLKPLDEPRAIKLRQRLWGAAVLIALAVIILPLLLDGSGSESRFRRVERLREEPPRIVDAEGNRETVPIAGPDTALDSGDTPNDDNADERVHIVFSENGELLANSEQPDAGDSEQPEAGDHDATAELAENGNQQAVDDVTGRADTDSATRVFQATDAPTRNNLPLPTAWVVQTGSFRNQSNAIAVRDNLRSKGFPSFVSPLSEDDSLFRVQVGPMIDKNRAATTRDKIKKLLEHDAIVVAYP